MTELLLPRLVLDAVDAEVSGTTRGATFLLNRDPAPGERDVPLASAVTLEIARVATDPPGAGDVRVWIGGELAFDAGAVTAPFAGPGSAVVRSGDVLRLVFVPRIPFASLAAVSVRVVIAATSLDATYAFVAEDRTPPRLLGAAAAGPRMIRLAFDEPVFATPSLRIEFEPLDPPAVSAEVADVRSVGTELQLTLSRLLSPGRRYRVRVAGVVDARGNGVAPPADAAIFAAFAPTPTPGRRFDLFAMLPKHNRRLDTTGDLARFMGCLQEVTDLLLAEIDRLADFLDIERAPEAVLDRILIDLGNPFAFDLTVTGKRRLASLLVAMYQQKGTAAGIRNALRFFMGLDGAVVQALSVEPTLGGGILGGAGGLAPSARFLRYAFELVVPVTLTPTERAYVQAIVRWMKPAHTHFVRIVEPQLPTPRERWELGRDELGDTVAV